MGIKNPTNEANQFEMSTYKRELDQIVASVASHSDAARRLDEDDY